MQEWWGYGWDCPILPILISKQGAQLEHLDSGHKTYAEGITIRSDTAIPANKACFYFEMTVEGKGQDGSCAIGICGSIRSYQGMPGSLTGAYGYHGNDGCKYFSGDRWSYGPTFSKGDTVGLCVDRTRQTFFFTRNGNRLGDAMLPDKGEWYPAVGLYRGGDKVALNFGRHEFKFDIATYKWELKQYVKSQIGAAPLGGVLAPGAVAQLVTTYLVHQGYSKTTRLLCNNGDTDHRLYNLEQMQARQGIRELLVAGNIDQAVERTNEAFPTVLQEDTRLLFRLECFRFIAMIANKKSWETIVAFGKKIQATFDGSPDLNENDEIRELLRHVFSLVAYANPAESPAKWLLEEEQRVQVACALNEAILVKCQSRRKSNLENLVRHAVLTRERLLEESVAAASMTSTSDFI